MNLFWFHILTQSLSIGLLLAGCTAAALLPDKRSVITHILHPIALTASVCGLLFLLFTGQEVVNGLCADSVYEQHQTRYRLFGIHAWAFWLHSAGRGLLPALLGLPIIHRNLGWMASTSAMNALTLTWIWWSELLPLAKLAK